MGSFNMYNRKDEPDHISCLYDIINYSKAGAATSDTCQNIAHLESVMCCLFELIHDTASEAVELAEAAEDNKRT